MKYYITQKEWDLEKKENKKIIDWIPHLLLENGLIPVRIFTNKNFDIENLRNELKNGLMMFYYEWLWKEITYKHKFNEFTVNEFFLCRLDFAVTSKAKIECGNIQLRVNHCRNFSLKYKTDI